MSDDAVETCPKHDAPIDDCYGCATEGLVRDAPCPAWTDGQHCYSETYRIQENDIGKPDITDGVKRCACGKTVERT